MNKTAFITGTSRGLGHALVTYFLQKNCTVYCIVRTKKNAIEMRSVNPEHCFPIISDVTLSTVATDIAKVVPESTKIDILINNAGTSGHGTSLEKTSANDTSQLVDVHCIGAIRITKAVLPFFQNQGIVINISSRFGSVAKIASGELNHIPCSYSYRISKAAQNMFTLCLSQEFAKTNIKACSIHPGKLKTETASKDADREPEEAAKKIFGLLETIENGKFYNLFEGEFSW